MELIAIKKDGIYYCRENDKYPHEIPNDINLKFNTLRLKSFDQKWAVFKTLPTSAETRTPGKVIITEYRLKDSYTATIKTPLILPPIAFECIDYETSEFENQEIRGLYNAIEKQIPDTWETIPLEIDIIDEDCEPLINPKYEFHTTFPYYIENHEVVRHKYPCYIPGKDVFQLIRTAVKEKLPKQCIISSDYDFHFVVRTKIPVIHEETHKVDISKMVSKKPKMVIKPLRDIYTTIIDIQPENKYNSTLIPDIHANNYKHLESNVDYIIQTYLNKLSWKPTVCPHCKGYGWIEGE